MREEEGERERELQNEKDMDNKTCLPLKHKNMETSQEKQRGTRVLLSRGAHTGSSKVPGPTLTQCYKERGKKKSHWLKTQTSK